MRERNYGVCHGCRGVGHFFDDCPIKRRCPDCVHRFQKFFVVEKNTDNKGRFFKCCSVRCGFWDWCEAGEAIGESSNAHGNLDRPVAHDEGDNLPRMFQSQLRLSTGEEILISVNVNVTVTRGKAHVDGKVS